MDIADQETGLQASRLQTLNEIGRVVSATLDLHAVYETIYEQVGRVMDTTQFFIALLRPVSQTLDLVYHREAERLVPSREIQFGPNVTSLVVQRGMSLCFQDHREYVDFATENGLPEVTIGQDDSEAKVWVPLDTNAGTIGALSVQSTGVSAYTIDDVQTLSVIASQAAVSIENARLYLRSQEDLQRMEALLSVAQIVNSSLDLQTVLESILLGMREVMPYLVGAVFLPDHRNGWLDIVGAVGPLADERRHDIKVPFGCGVTGQVFASGEPLNVADVTKFEGYIGHGVDEIRAEMALPLKRGDTVIGVLDIERDAVDSFSKADADLMMLFASQAAIAIENARLFQEQQKRVHELQAIQNIVQQLTALHDIRSIAAAIDRQLNKLIEFHSCRIFSRDTRTETLEPVSTSGSDAFEISLRVGEGIVGWVAQHGEPVIISNTLDDSRVLQIAGTPRREESIIAVPLVYQGRVRGVLALARLGVAQFDENSLRLLEILAAQAAIAFDRAMLYQRLRNEAITDPLTKLYNRRYLHERFREERSRAIRNRHALYALMLDIDKFKRVNDTFGHEAGDVVLSEVARLIRSGVRVEDLVARHGGEEFCVLLPECSPDSAEAIAERLRWLIDNCLLAREAGVKRITVSIGIAALDPGDQANEVFTRADLAMYEAKRRGGNSVCMIHDGALFFPADEIPIERIG